MIASGESGVFVLVTFPNRVQAGHVVELLQDWNEPGHLYRIRWHVSFFRLKLKIWRSIEKEGQRHVLRQVAGRIGLKVVVVKLAQNLRFFLRLIESLRRL